MDIPNDPAPSARAIQRLDVADTPEDARQRLIDTVLAVMQGLPQVVAGQVDRQTCADWARDLCDHVLCRVTGESWDADQVPAGIDVTEWDLVRRMIGIEIDNMRFFRADEIGIIAAAVAGRGVEKVNPADIVARKLCQRIPEIRTRRGWSAMMARMVASQGFTGPRPFCQSAGWERHEPTRQILRQAFPAQDNPWMPHVYTLPPAARSAGLVLAEFLLPSADKRARMAAVAAPEIEREYGYRAQCLEQVRHVVEVTRHGDMKTWPVECGLAIRLDDRWAWRRIRYNPDEAAANFRLVAAYWETHVLKGEAPPRRKTEQRTDISEEAQNLLRFADTAHHVATAAATIRDTRRARFETQFRNEIHVPDDTRHSYDQDGLTVTFKPVNYRLDGLKTILRDEGIPIPQGEGETLKTAMLELLTQQGHSAEAAASRSVEYRTDDQNPHVQRLIQAATKEAETATGRLDMEMFEILQ